MVEATNSGETGPKRMRRVKGQAEQWSEEDLDKLSEITEADEQRAADFWDSAAPPWAKGLLEAESEEADT